MGIFVKILPVATKKVKFMYSNVSYHVIKTYNNIGRYNLIDTKNRQMALRSHQMALQSVPTSHLLEPLVKQK